ncbi:MAG: hypothetical protein CLLPBCKN_007309 [Chroococcidiopsis cubana SAG 39.79]|nr:CPBP family intramembrane glutamic endopeptidase [Chroococcidiopsis cubana]MDZ4877874.1 hypothetical protein [Chroococcidiopsis cubana SAG 39.79]
MPILCPKFATYPVPARIGIFLLVLMLLWLPIAVPIYWVWGTVTTSSTIALLILYVEFFWLLQIWGRKVHRQSQPLQYHGLVRTRQNGFELLTALGIGFISLFTLFLFESWMGWLTWQPLPRVHLSFGLEGLLVGLGVGVAEELLFRGWLIDELRWNCNFKMAMWISSTIYAALHFIKPWTEIVRTLPSFPGLLLLGLTLGWARQVHQKRLGFAIGLHAGLVWGYYLVDVSDWINYTNQVPEWVTGINQNPLAGIVGFGFLCALAFVVRKIGEFGVTLD